MLVARGMSRIDEMLDHCMSLCVRNVSSGLDCVKVIVDRPFRTLSSKGPISEMTRMSEIVLILLTAIV